MRGEQYDQLLASRLLARGAEKVPQDGDSVEKRHACLVRLIVLPDEAADHDSMAVLDHEVRRCFRFVENDIRLTLPECDRAVGGDLLTQLERHEAAFVHLRLDLEDNTDVLVLNRLGGYGTARGRCRSDGR